MPLQKVTMLSQQCPFEGISIYRQILVKSCSANFPHSSFLRENYISLCFHFLNTCRVQRSTEEGFSREKIGKNLWFKTHMHAHTHVLKPVMHMRELENKTCLQSFIWGSSTGRSLIQSLPYHKTGRTDWARQRSYSQFTKFTQTICDNYHVVYLHVLFRSCYNSQKINFAHYCLLPPGLVV